MLYWYILRFNFQRFIHYPTEIVAALLTKILTIAFIVIFWRIVLGELGDSARIGELTSYFLIAEGLGDISMTYNQKFGSLLRKSIKSGEISNSLIKPYKVLPALYASVWGQRSVNTIPAILMIIASMILNPPASPFSLILFLYFGVIAASLAYSLNLFEGVLTFYVTQPDGIVNSLAHFTRIMSGSFIPLTYFPVAIREIARFSPFAMMIFTPIEALRIERMTEETLILCFVALFWALLFNGVVYLMWRKGVKQYEAIGL